MNEKIYSAIPEQADIRPDPQNGKVMAILAYIGLLVLVPIFAAKDDRYAQFHAKQGALNCIISLAYFIVTTIIKALLRIVFKPTVGLFYIVVDNPVVSLFSTIFGIASLFFVAMAVVGIVNAATGKTKPLPFIGNFRFLDRFFHY